MAVEPRYLHGTKDWTSDPPDSRLDAVYLLRTRLRQIGLIAPTVPQTRDDARNTATRRILTFCLLESVPSRSLFRFLYFVDGLSPPPACHGLRIRLQQGKAVHHPP